MDIVIHWGVLRYLHQEIDANPVILVIAIVLDVFVLAALLVVKASTDMLIIWAAIIAFLFILAGERLFLRRRTDSSDT